MKKLIDSYEIQLAAITARITQLRKFRKNADSNLSYNNLTYRLEMLEVEQAELERTIGRLKQHI